jgi:hypothetical protein
MAIDADLDGPSPDAGGPRKPAGYKRDACDEKRRFQSRHCPIVTHTALQSLDRPEQDGSDLLTNSCSL